MNSERLVHAFAQTPRRARIEIHQFAMQSVQRLFGCVVIFHRVGRVQLLRDQRLVFLADVIQHIAPLVYLTALDRRRFAGILLHRRMQCLAAIQHIQPRLGEVQPTIHQIAQQFTDDGGVLGGSLPNAQNRFRPSWPMPSAATIC